MAFTEKVLVSGTALSFLFYECAQSQHGQEGFLLGDVTSEVTSHISDSQNDQSRIDTDIVVRTVLPLPGVGQVYGPCGRVREDRLAEFLAGAAANVVGWYRYRRGNSLKPTLRDKVVTRALQRYFERNHGRKHFVLCNVATKESSCASTHTFSYRFGKMNCLNAYEHVEDATPNLGEKLSGYRRLHRHSPHSVFSSIMQENDVRNAPNAVHRIQAAVDARLREEAKAAVDTERVIRELETEIEQMTTIMAERHCVNIQATADKLMKHELADREKEMAKICAEALSAPATTNLANFSEYIASHAGDTDDVEIVERKEIQRELSPIIHAKAVKNYAAALKNVSKAETSATSNRVNALSDELIELDMEIDKEQVEKTTTTTKIVKCMGDSSPEY